jgi:cytochrome c peroxidase
MKKLPFNLRRVGVVCAVVGLGSVLGTALADVGEHRSLRDLFNQSIRYTDTIEFTGRIYGSGDPDAGRANFGIGADGLSLDPTEALFSGHSVVGGNIVSNGTTCATCHRPDPGLFLGLPPLPLSATIPLTDVLFAERRADIGDDPLGIPNFDQLGLLLHRPTRFDPLLPIDDPRRQVFFWRKTNRLINTVLTHGFLNDGRMRQLVETARGAVFTHTQEGDLRFDDLISRQRLLDISRFMEEQIDPPELRALLNPNDPMYQTLINDPFATVHATTPQERLGQNVFRRYCMTCHNMPNVFSNRTHRDNPPDSTPPPFGETFDIGISQRNLHNLEFRRFDVATGQRVPIVLPLVDQAGTTHHVTVVDDVGLAAATGRYEDLHKFKVPQLRRISQLGPYFHDNTAATLEEVVDYFNGPVYNSSPDGRRFPIHLSPVQRDALLAFLRIL